jgi:electron transfer flavoprotein alpha subunit
MTTTWVFVEETEEGPATVGLEILTKARGFGGELAAVYLGAGSDDNFATLGAHGATRVYHLVPSDALPPAAAAAALADLAGEHSPDLIMFGLTYTDRDVAGRLSARMGKTVLSNATDISVEDGTVTVTNEIFGGTTLVETVFEGEAPYLVIARPKSFLAEPSGGGLPDIEAVALPDVGHSGAAMVTASHTERLEGPKLEEAAIVVAAGRGIGTEEGFAVIDELASKLGAATGATRAIVDAGWVPYSKQVGQTGKTVKPDVYLAAGVSGAMQHLVGMKDSKVIIAINKDEEAPIFGVSDLGVIGDLHKVLPKLIEALSNR